MFDRTSVEFRHLLRLCIEILREGTFAYPKENLNHIFVRIYLSSGK